MYSFILYMLSRKIRSTTTTVYIKDSKDLQL